MSTFALVIGLAVLVSGGSAQVVVEDIWSAVAYIYHGEHTPSEGSDSPSLTPLGAQQMYAQGTRFRARYLEEGSVTGDQDGSPTNGVIEGIAAVAIDNTQLSIMTTGDQYASAGALSFIQALYPPTTDAFSKNAGGLDAAVLANGSLINYPLGGYQYPDIRVLSVLDPNSIWIEGHVACARYYVSQSLLSDDPVANQAYDQSLGFYRTLWKKNVFLDAFPLDAANFYNAHDLFAYASYRYNHDNTTHSEMTEADLTMLADLASVQQLYLNGNLGAFEFIEADVTRTIAGRTLAAKVVSQFSLNLASSGSSNKLNLMFGSFEPVVAFFTISRLIDGPSGDSFLLLPGPGAAIVFELFSVGGNASAYPSVDDLWVRFLYRKDSLDDTPFVEYPLFGNGNSQSRMKLIDFVTAVEGISVGGLAQWCNVCDTTNLFCLALEENSGSEAAPVPSGGQGKKITPVVAGIIGALVTAAVVGLTVVLAMFVGRVRFYREGHDRSSSTFGGFRGAEKMKSDADVTYAGNGAQHERTGSWQLRDGKGAAERPIATPPAAVLGTSDRTSPVVQHGDYDDDDDISVLGQTPVAPRESI